MNWMFWKHWSNKPDFNENLNVNAGTRLVKLFLAIQDKGVDFLS